MRRLLLALSLLFGCSEPSTLFLSLTADADVRGPADVVRAGGRELRRVNGELRWPIEVAVQVESGAIDVAVEVEPHPQTDGEVVSVRIRGNVDMGSEQQLRVDVSRSGDLEVDGDDLEPHLPRPALDDRGCEMTPAPFADWGFFVNHERGYGCVAFMDKIGCELELIEDCTAEAPRPSWRGGIRESDNTFFLTSETDAIGCDGIVDETEPRVARFACDPAHLGLRFARLDDAQPFVKEERRFRLQDRAHTIRTNVAYNLIIVGEPGGISAFDPRLGLVARFEGSIDHLEVGADAVYTAGRGAIDRRHPISFEVQATSAEIAGVRSLFDTDVGLLVVSYGEVMLLDHEDLHPLFARPSTGLLRPVAHFGGLFFLLQEEPRPSIVTLDAQLVLADDFPLPFEPLAFASPGDRLAFVARCPGEESIRCYIELDPIDRNIVLSLPLTSPPIIDPFNGILLLGDRAVVYGSTGLELVDLDARQPWPERKVALEIVALAEFGGEFFAIESAGADVRSLVRLQP
jgi:hypothetical protein